MSSKPIAVVGSMHTCPMCNGSTPHVGGAITTSSAPGVTINGMPIALQGDMCSCVGATDTIVQGVSGITINGIPIATVGCKTAHGGEITTGVSGVMITTTTPLVTLPEREIPFPKTTVVAEILTVLSGNSNHQARANQEQLRGQEEGEPIVFNLQWVKDETISRGSQQIRQITLVGDVINIPDGQTASLTFDVPEVFDRPEETVTLSGTVENKKVAVIWEIEDLDNHNT